MSSDTQTETQRYIGQVKWFNNRAGYGFITMTDESGTEKDVFAHFSTIKMEQGQYKFLVQGEYVEFNMSASTNEGHEFQATNVTGINGGSLMCETRQQNRYPNRPPPAPRAGPPRGHYRHYGPPPAHYHRRPYPRREGPPPAAGRRESDDGFQKVEKRRNKPVAKTEDVN